MSDERLSVLIEGYLDAQLTDAERSELEETLRGSAAARAQFWQDTRLHGLLHEVEHADGAGESRHSTAPSRRVPGWLLAVALLLAAGAVITGLVLWPNAHSIRGIFTFAEKRESTAAATPAPDRVTVLPIVAAGFEDAAVLGGKGLPKTFGIWSGDDVASVPAERAIQPLHGEKMLRFLRTFPTGAPVERALISSEQWQLIDLRPWRAALAGSRAAVEFGVWFNRTPAPGSTRRFGVGVFACQGEPSDAPRLWRDNREETLAHAGTQILADDDPATWERAEVRVTLPEDTDFLIVTITAVRLPRVPGAPDQFEGHYADDVALTLHMPPPRRLTPRR